MTFTGTVDSVETTARKSPVSSTTQITNGNNTAQTTPIIQSNTQDTVNSEPKTDPASATLTMPADNGSCNNDHDQKPTDVKVDDICFKMVTSENKSRSSNGTLSQSDFERAHPSPPPIPLISSTTPSTDESQVQVKIAVEATSQILNSRLENQLDASTVRVVVQTITETAVDPSAIAAVAAAAAISTVRERKDSENVANNVSETAPSLYKTSGPSQAPGSESPALRAPSPVTPNAKSKTFKKFTSSVSAAQLPSDRPSRPNSAAGVRGEASRRSFNSISLSRSLSNIDQPSLSEYDVKRKQIARRIQDKGLEVGTKITEGHANYVLMYDMLTGIRHAVSRCVAKPDRPLVYQDFRAKHKLAFDIMGNEMTPSSMYEFKFKDYAPWVFRNIREIFKIEAADYLMALTGKYVLSELGSPGKSGSFFYFSQDYRFIIKTIHHTEHKFLRSILEQYLQHIKKYPNTLLSRYYGLHRVKLPHGRKIHFVVMGNVFPPNHDVHETFDLKGSLVGREVSDEEIKSNPRIVKKDLNWIRDKRSLLLGPEKSKLFGDQLQNDVDFLMKMNIMDYSLLLGIHYLERGNSENIRDIHLSVFEPHAEVPLAAGSRMMRATNIRKILAQADPIQLGPSSSKLPETSPAERSAFMFYSEYGGMHATNQNNQLLPEIYYVGIIDITTPYNMVKKIEHIWKSLNYDKDLISAVNPLKYGRRFLNFMMEKVISAKRLADTSDAEMIAALEPKTKKGEEIIQMEPL